MADLAFAAIWIALALYAVLGGADFGAGIWEAVTRMRLPADDRELLYGAIGPVWEANHVWLVFALVLTMTAFPAAFALLATALMLPLVVAIAGIVFRGSAFVFRAYGPGVPRFERGWSAAFGLASTAAPLAFGIAAGTLASGPPGTGDVSSAFLPVICGCLAPAACAYLAAVYLAREAAARRSEPLMTAWRRRALAAGTISGVLALSGVAAMAIADAPLWPGFRDRAWPLVALSAAAALTSFGALVRRRFTVAAAGAALAVAAVIAGWAVAQHPFVVPGAVSTADHAPDAVLVALLVASAAGMLVLVPSLVFLLRLFKSMPRRR